MPRVPLSVMISPSFNVLQSVDSVQHLPPPRATKAAGDAMPPRAVTTHRAEEIDNTVGHNDPPPSTMMPKSIAPTDSRPTGISTKFIRINANRSVNGLTAV